MKLFIQSIWQTICLSLLLFTAALVVQGKEKRETPTKRTEAASSKLIPALHIPRVHRVHPMLSKPSLPLSLDPIRFTLQADKPTITVGEEVEITINAQLLDIPTSAFFIFEEQKSFSVKVLLPQGFTQTGGDYQEYTRAQLTPQNNTFTKRLRGVFTSLPANPCFVLLRGAYNVNASSVFEQKQILCLTKKDTPKATREADCTAPVLTPIAAQTICYGGGFYMVSTNVTNGVEVYYQWYNDNGVANANTNPIEGEQRANLRSFPTAPGVYQYKVVATSSASSSCSASQSVTLTVHALPTISSTTSTNPSCTPNDGGTISVVAAGGSALLYSKDNGGNWVDLTGLSAQDEITRNTLLYTTEKDVAKVKITLENGFGIGPGGEYTGEISSQSAAPTFEGLAAGTYSIRVKNENGCISTPNEVTLTNPNAPAIFNVTGGGTCASGGAPINLSGSSVGVNYSLLRNGVTVTAGVAGTGSALSFGNQTAEGTYTVMATNTTTNCSAQMNNNVVISTGTPPAAPVTIGGDKLFCAANATVLEVSVAGGQTADWYAAATGGTPLNQGLGVTSFAPSTAGIYYVETRDITTQCKSSTRTAVTLLAAPTLSITGNTEIGCGNTSSLLSAYTNTALPTGTSISYAWKNDPSGPVLATTDTLRVNSAGTYTLTLTYGSCALTASQTVSSTTATDPSATLSSSARIACSGSLSIVPTLVNTTASTVYEWSGPNGFTANTANIEVTQAGTYTLAVKKNATTPCSTQEIFVDEKPASPQDPSLTAARLSIDPENSTALLARGCSSLVSWSYISNDPPAESLNGFVAGSNTSTSVTLENTSPNLTLTYQNTPFQTSATYTAACIGECQNSTASIPITIFKNICGIKVQADQNAVVANTPVTLTAFFCETSNITWSTGQTGTRTITVTPTVTTTYFVVCNLPNQKACTDYVEIKTMPTICQNFTVNASAAEIEQGQQVTLMALGCTGQFTWKNDLGSLPTVTVYPNTTTTFTGICTIGTTSCEQTVNVKVKCDIVVKVTPIYDGSLWGIIAYKKVNVWASCNNSPLFINGERVEGGSYGSKLLDGTNDLTIVVSCGEGVEACSKTIQVRAVTRTCRDFAISATTNAGNLTLTASGCSEGNTVTWDNGMSGGTITIPLPIKPTMFKAICGRNGCENYYTYEKNYVNEYFTIRQKPGNGYPITLWPLNCTGTVSWESTPLTDFSVDINKNLTISQQPTQTTTYTATCKTDDNYIVKRTYTIQAATAVACISILAPQSIEKGAVVTLSTVGCVGTPFWKKSTNTTGAGLTNEQWLASMTPIGSGQSIIDQPLVETIYWVECENNATCFNNHIVKIKPCNFTVSATKTTLKAGELTTLTAGSCPAGTINWINSTGELLGWGPQITLQLVKNTTVKAVCDVSKCENTLQITVPSGNPEEIICENLTLTANPNRPIYTGEPNTVTITATGCTGGTVTWNGPLLTTDTKTQYPSHQITIDNLQQAASYTAVCTKTSLPPTQATISIAAEIRFTLKAVPQAVEAGNTTLLTAEGCVGGAITWTSPVSACGSVPCSITSPAISAPATFTATCTINGQTLSKSVNVYLKSANGSIVYQSQCSNFNATYSLPSATLSPPYPKNTRIELYSSGCTGTVKWNAVDNQGNQRALTGTFSGLTDYPQLPTTYTATCEVNAQICATRSFYIPIHQSSCGENGFSVTWAEAKPGVPPSGAGQLSGAQTGSNAGKFFQESVQLGVPLVDQNGFSSYTFTISATGCRSLDTNLPGLIEVLVNGAAPLTLQKLKAGDKIRISCKANPTTFPNEECYQILCIDGVANNAYNPFFIRDCGKTTARQGVADGLAAIQQTTSTEQTTSSGCTASYPLKDLMAGYYKTLICNNISAFYDEFGQFSEEKAKAFLLAVEANIKTQPALSSYTLVFPTDYTAIINSIREAGLSCTNSEAIAKSITVGFDGNMLGDDFNTFENAQYTSTENAGRNALAVKYVFLTPDLRAFVINSANNTGYKLINCATVPAVPLGTVPGFRIAESDYCAVIDPATGLYTYQKDGLLSAPASGAVQLTGAITATTHVKLVWGLGNCPIQAQMAIVSGNQVAGKTKEQIAQLIENGLPNIEDIPCTNQTFCDTRVPQAEQLQVGPAGGRVAALDPNRYFIAPDGRAIKLPAGATPLFFNFQVPYFTPPTGTLQGIKTADGKQYFADIAIGSGTFFGYRLLETPTVCPGTYLEKTVSIYVTLPSSLDANVYYIENYKANGQCGYQFIESQYRFVPTPKTIIDLAPLTGTVTERWTKTCPTEEVQEFYGNQFKITTLNGNITVQGTWQTFGKCPTCPAIAEAALQAALNKAKAKNGTITHQTKIIEAIAIPYGDPNSPNFLGNIAYSDMNLLDLLKNLSKSYNSLVDKAKVPEAVWKPQEDLPTEDKDFFVQDKTRVISGALDQAVEEIKDIPELVGLGLKVVSDPVGAKNELISFAQNMSWQKAKDFAIEAAKSAVQIDYLTNPKNEYKLYGTGRLGVSIVKLAAGGAALTTVAITKKAPDFLALWNRLRDKMDNLGWVKLDRDAFRADFENTEDLLNKFDDGTLDPQAWRLMKDTQSKKVHLPTLTKVTELLRDADFMAKLQGGETTLTDILKNAANPLDAGTASKLVTLTEHLENLRIVVKNHHDVEGFDKILTDLKISTFEKQDGITHSLNHMKELPAGSVQKVDYVFEPEVDGGLPCTNCRFDVQMIKPAVPPANWVKYYEYKSYLKAENIGLEQFKNYLATVDNLSELRYIFNAKKLTTDQAKIGMKAFLKANADKIIKPVSEGGIGEVKFNQLFATDDVDVFKARLENANYFNQYTSFVDSK